MLTGISVSAESGGFADLTIIFSKTLIPQKMMCCGLNVVECAKNSQPKKLIQTVSFRINQNCPSGTHTCMLTSEPHSP